MTRVSSLYSLASRSPPSVADRLLKAQQQRKYVKELWLFLGGVIALLTCIRVIRCLFSFVFRPKRPVDQFSREKGNVELVSQVQNGKISLRRIPSALTAAFRIVAFRWTIPIGPRSVASVSELLFIIGYIVAIFIWLLVDTRDLSNVFWEDRAAHFASCQLPLIVALAGKNNIISFVTGIGHEKLNVLHRAAARTCLVLLWMHAVARTVAGLPEQFDFTHGWMRSGAIGLTAFSLATLLSIRPIRQLAFEFFLISHIVLVAIFLICGYMHARDPGFGDYIWPALVIWAFDRVLRGSRILWNNRLWNLTRNEHSTAIVELLSDDTVRLTLRRRFSWIPGQHAYVICPTISKIPFEAHPFTIASVPKKLNGTDDQEVVFLIRGRAGFTQRLRDHAIETGGSTIPAYLDGPYGYPPNLTNFSTCILIAGGSGVSYTLPLLLNLVRQAREGKSSVRRVVFLWAVRDGAHLTWISRVLTEALTIAPSTLSIEPRVYVTGVNFPILEVPSIEYEKSTPPSSPSTSIDKHDKTGFDLPIYSALKLTHGRPSIPKLLKDEITTSVGRVSVDVAGPSALSQSVRRALRSELAGPVGVLKGLPSVELHVETFGMVKG